MSRSVRQKLLLAGLVVCTLLSVADSAIASQLTPLFKPLLSLGRGDITNVEWQASNNHIFVSTNHTLWVYDNQLNDITHSDGIRLTAVHPIQNLLAAQYQGKPTILDSITLQPIKIFDTPTSALLQLRWSSDGSKLAAALTNGLVEVWDAKTYRLLLQFWESSGTLNWSPDSTKLLALDPGENTASVWDVSTQHRQRIFNLEANSKYPTGGGRLIWNPDGSHFLRLASLGEIGFFQNWDVYTGKLIYEREDGGTFSATYSSDGKKLVLSTLGHGLVSVDPLTFETRVTYKLAPQYSNAKWSPDGNFVVAYGDGYPTSPDGFLGIWNANTDQIALAFKMHSAVTSIQWSPDGHRFLTVNKDNALRIMDVSTGSIQFENDEHTLASQLVAWSTDASKVAIADRVERVRIWDTTKAQITATLQGSPEPRQIVWQPSGKLLAVLSFVDSPVLNSERNVAVNIWDTDSTEKIASIPFPDYTYIDALTWSKDGKRLLIATTGNVMYWDVGQQDAKPLFDLSKSPIHFLSILATFPSPDDTKLLVSSYNNCIMPALSMWDTRTGEYQKMLDWKPELVRSGVLTWNLTSDKVYRTSWRTPTSYCGDGGSDHPVLDPDRFNVWVQVIYRADGSSEIPPMLVLNHSDWVTSLDWSPDLTRIATTTADKYLRVWDANTGKIEQTIANVQGYSWSPDGHLLAFWQINRTIHVLNVSTGKATAILPDATGPLLWSPDSRFLAVTQSNGSAAIVDVTTGELDSTLNVGNPINWSPDSTEFTQFNDGQLTIWTKR